MNLPKDYRDLNPLKKNKKNNTKIIILSGLCHRDKHAIVSLVSNLKMIRLVNIQHAVFLLILLRLQTQVTCPDL